MTLPPEVLCKVFRALTDVPGALDSAFYDGNDEEGEELLAAVRLSMKDKLAVALVSKEFYALAIRYLFEVIAVRRLSNIRTLVKLLRRSRGENQVLRGHWVRRLDITLSRPEEDPKDDEGCNIWNMGSITLYGLLPACPNLQILHLSLPSPSTKLFRIPEAFCQTLAQHTPYIRQLSLRGQLYLPLGRLERMLHSLPHLQVLKVEGASDLEPAYDDARDRTGHPALFMVLATCRRGLCAADIAEYECALAAAHWPAPPLERTDDDAPVLVLPALHTLALSAFSARTARWSLPALQRAQLAGERPPQDLLLALHRSLVPSARTLTHLSYAGPPLPLWPLVGMLPMLRALDVRATAHVHAPSALPGPHAALAQVVLRQGRYVGTELADALEELDGQLRAGRLPALARLEVRLDEGVWWHGEQNDVEQGFRAMQAAVERLAGAVKQVAVMVGSEVAE